MTLCHLRGFSYLSPARQGGTVLLPAPLPLIWWSRKAVSLHQCAPGAWRPGGLPTKEAYTKGPNVSLPPARGIGWGLMRNRTAQQPTLSGDSLSPGKDLSAKSPNRSLLSTWNSRWGLSEKVSRRARPRRARMFHRKARLFLFPGPIGGSLRGPYLPLGPSVQTLLRKRPPPHPAGAQARRVYKRVGHRATKFRTHSGSGRQRTGKSNFRPRRVRLPDFLSCIPVNGRGRCEKKEWLSAFCPPQGVHPIGGPQSP